MYGTLNDCNTGKYLNKNASRLKCLLDIDILKNASIAVAVDYLLVIDDVCTSLQSDEISVLGDQAVPKGKNIDHILQSDSGKLERALRYNEACC